MNKTSLEIVNVLKASFAEKQARNQRYSLRAFARDLKVEPSLLSKILRSNHRVTSKMIARMAPAIGLSALEVRSYIKSMRDEREIEKKEKRARYDEFVPFNLDHFRFISAWYHVAILELFNLKSFKASPAWIAERLGIEVVQAEEALNRLVRMGFIETRKGSLRLAKRQNSTIVNDPQYTTEALKTLQTQFLKKAGESFYQVDINYRNQSTLTFSVNHKNLEKIKSEIAKFRRKINGLSQKDLEHHDSVYNITISLYPLTKIDQEIADSHGVSSASSRSRRRTR
ncbi:TIGR02147 family protein [Bdellovibrio sp.]|uniref:TIGR02147 family protein n=1 Tax=Bdellovibrio sp. TaxID=28201 RepID=UPI0039E6BF23